MTFLPRVWSLVALIFFIVSVSLTACTDSTGPDIRNSIRILSGGAGTDTIMTSGQLVFEVLDENGNPMPQTTVMIEIDPDINPEQLGNGATSFEPLFRPFYVCNSTIPRCASVSDFEVSIYTATHVITDDTGVARVSVQYGVRSGSATVTLSVPSHDISKTLQYVTRPGAFAKVSASVRDTTLYVGRQYPLTPFAADRFGNPRNDPVSTTVLTPGVLTLTNHTVTTQGLGRGKILIQAGAFKDTAFVSVPPQGRLVAYRNNTINQAESEMGKLVLLNTDGSAHRELTSTHGQDNVTGVTWDLAGSHILFQESGPMGAPPLLYQLDTAGNRREFMNSSMITESRQAAIAQNTGNVYFLGTSPGHAGTHKVSSDGSSVQFLFDGNQPAPSPDESQVAFVRNDTLYVRNMMSGVETRIANRPAFARWSPNGNYIAFVSSSWGYVRIITPTGSSVQSLTRPLSQGVSWSSDSQWIIYAYYEGGLEMMRVSNGERLPISGTAALREPSWRP